MIHSINNLEVSIYKLENMFMATLTKWPENFMVESFQFEIDNLLNKKFRTAKEITNLVDNLSMSFKL